MMSLAYFLLTVTFIFDTTVFLAFKYKFSVRPLRALMLFTLFVLLTINYGGSTLLFSHNLVKAEFYITIIYSGSTLLPDKYLQGKCTLNLQVFPVEVHSY